MADEVAKETTAAVPENAPAKQEAKPAAAVEKQTNCLGCNKPLKKLRVYYRNGKFYCTKRCWLKAVEKSKEEKK